MNKSTQSDHFEAISAPEATIFGPKSTLWAPKSQKKKSENLWRLQGGLPTPHGTRFLTSFWSPFWGYFGPVSYTHLTLPTIYSV